MDVKQIYFSEFKIIHLSIKEFKTQIEEIKENINKNFKRCILLKMKTNDEIVSKPTAS